MKLASVGAMLAGAVVGAGAATAVAMSSHQTQKRLKKAVQKVTSMI